MSQRVSVQRVSVQGVSVQGVSVQGVSVQGVGVQGVSVQGVSVQGVSVQGIRIQGVSVQGVSVRGVMSCHRVGWAVTDVALAPACTIRWSAGAAQRQFSEGESQSAEWCIGSCMTNTQIILIIQLICPTYLPFPGSL